MDIDSVMDTNDEASNCKRVIHELKYIQDDYISYFTNTPKRHFLPLINRGYYSRVLSIERIVNSFLDHYSSKMVDDQPLPIQIVNFGAGFDTKFFRLSQKYPSLTIVEFDFVDVTSSKCQIIEQSSTLNQIVGDSMKISDDGSRLNSDRYHIIPADLRDVDMVMETMSMLVDSKAPTLFISEVCFIYIPASHVDKLLKQVSSYFSQGEACFCLYEPTNPFDNFGKEMVNKLDKRGCGLKSLSTYPLIQDQVKRFNDLGFTGPIKAYNMNQVYDCFLNVKDRQHAQRIEMFDEYEEWNLIQNHYFICLAAIVDSKRMDNSFVQSSMFDDWFQDQLKGNALPPFLKKK